MAVLAIQLAALNPFSAWHTTAIAQDAGEGSSPCAAPDANQPDPEPEDEDADGADSDSDENDDDMGDDLGGDAGDDGGDDGGDSGDGGGVDGDSSGTDNDGDDGPSADGGSGPIGGAGGPDTNIATVSDPIDVRLADKRHVQVDYRARGAAPLRFARVYHSNSSVNTARVSVPMGTGWHMFYDRSLQVLSGSQIRLHRANGRTLDFSPNGSAFVSAMPAGALTAVSGDWQYVNHRNVVELYDASGRLVSMASGGHVTSFQYDGSGRLVAVLNPFGRRLALSYDGAGRVATITLPDGTSLNYGYDSRNNLISARFADNSVRQYVYDNANFPNALTGVVDESGRRRLTWGYDPQGRPNRGYYGNGINTVTVAYNGSQVTTTDARGTQRIRTIALVGARTVVTGLQTLATSDSAATSWAFSYDAIGNPLGVTTRSGEVQQLSADSRGRVQTIVRASGTPQALNFQKTWHPTFRKPTQVVALGITRNFTIDAVGRVTQIGQVSGGVSATLVSKTYNAQNLLQSKTDARGATTTFTYDTLGNRTSASNALGQVTTYQNFNANGRATRIQRADGAVITRTFNTRGKLTARSVAGQTTSYAYDTAGRLTQITAPDGGWRTISYDSAGLPNGTTNHRSETSAIARDVAGALTSYNVYSSTGTLAQSGAQQYNSVGRFSAVVDSRKYSTKYLYGTDGRLSGVRDALSQTTNLQLDVLSRATAVTQPNTTAMRQINGRTTVTSTATYDNAKSTQTAILDTNAVSTGYAYNTFNQRTGESNADGGNSGVVRNAAGDIVSTTDPRGNTLTWSRDALGRVVGITPHTGTAVGFSYVTGRRDGLLAKMTDSTGQTNWTYDATGRVLTKGQTVGATTRNITISRDVLGRPTSVTYPSGMTLGVAYAGNVVSSLTINSSTLLNNISYQPYSKIANRWNWGNGTSYSRSFDADGRVTNVTLGTVQRSFTYDALGRVNLQKDQNTQGTKQSTYTYDEAGHIIGYTAPDGTTQRYAWDAMGNRQSDVVGGTTRTYSYASGTNRLTALSGLRSYTYNADGSVANDTGFTYGYDNFGRVSSMSSSTQAGGYSYNGMGQRVTKAIRAYNPNSGTWAVKQTMQFVYDDAGHLLGEYDSTTGFSQETVWFNNQPVATIQGGAIYYVNADNLGTPRSVVRASDNLEVWRWDSDPFGTTAIVNPASTNNIYIYFNLRFPGQYFDNETGLHYNEARYYYPRTGRYIQSDPSGLRGGLSRYAYVGGNPLSYTDPDGLSPVLALYRSFGIGYKIGEALNPYVQPAIASALDAILQQTKTPNSGAAGSCHVNPNNGQERQYGNDGLPDYDIDWHPDHGAGVPHGHNWDRGPNGQPVRGPGVPLSPWPNGRGSGGGP